ncbi:unnamed protein product [Closterium sp. NIES-64]|nr:unnamed protein product [Closterium sp. NIES-64]
MSQELPLPSTPIFLSQELPPIEHLPSSLPLLPPSQDRVVCFEATQPVDLGDGQGGEGGIGRDGEEGGMGLEGGIGLGEGERGERGMGQMDGEGERGIGEMGAMRGMGAMGEMGGNGGEQSEQGGDGQECVGRQGTMEGQEEGQEEGREGEREGERGPHRGGNREGHGVPGGGCQVSGLSYPSAAPTAAGAATKAAPPPGSAEVGDKSRARPAAAFGSDAGTGDRRVREGEGVVVGSCANVAGAMGSAAGDCGDVPGAAGDCGAGVPGVAGSGAGIPGVVGSGALGAAFWIGSSCPGMSNGTWGEWMGPARSGQMEIVGGLGSEGHAGVGLECQSREQEHLNGEANGAVEEGTSGMGGLKRAREEEEKDKEEQGDRSGGRGT